MAPGGLVVMVIVRRTQPMKQKEVSAIIMMDLSFMCVLYQVGGLRYNGVEFCFNRKE